MLDKSSLDGCIDRTSIERSAKGYRRFYRIPIGKSINIDQNQRRSSLLARMHAFHGRRPFRTWNASFDIYRKSIESLLNIYRKLVENPSIWKLIENTRKFIEHISARKSTERLPNNYWKSIENLLNIHRSSTKHVLKIEDRIIPSLSYLRTVLPDLTPSPNSSRPLIRFRGMNSYENQLKAKVMLLSVSISISTCRSVAAKQVGLQLISGKGASWC